MGSTSLRASTHHPEIPTALRIRASVSTCSHCLQICSLLVDPWSLRRDQEGTGWEGLIAQHLPLTWFWAPPKHTRSSHHPCDLSLPSCRIPWILNASHLLRTSCPSPASHPFFPGAECQQEAPCSLLEMLHTDPQHPESGDPHTLLAAGTITQLGSYSSLCPFHAKYGNVPITLALVG